MIIGIYLENYRAGGLDRVISDLINFWPNQTDRFILFCNNRHEGISNFKKWIHRPFILVPYPTPFFMKWLSPNKKSSIIFMLNRFFYYFFWCYFSILWESIRIAHLFKKYQIDRVMIHNGGWPGARSTRSAILAGRIIQRKKVFLVIHNLAQKHYFFINLQEFFLENLLKKFGTKLITVSHAAALSLKQFTKLPNALVIYNGIRDLKKEAEISSSSCQEFNGGPNIFLMGMFGTFEKRRGHSILIKTMAIVVQKIPQAILLIAGTGTVDERQEIEQQIYDHSLQEHVRLLGFRNDVPQIINSLDIVVNPVQAFESFGLVSVEAMALKKPVVSSRIGGTPEVIEDGITGFLVDSQNPEQFAERIILLAQNPQLREKMGEAGYKRYNLNFRAERMAKDYYTLLTKGLTA